MAQIVPRSLSLPFSNETILKSIKMNGGITPFHLYSEERMRSQSSNLKKAFEAVGLTFKNHFAVKALPNPHVMKILESEGMGMDCSSVAELMLCDQIGLSGTDIMFTSNNTSEYEFREALSRGAIINLDDITHIDTLMRVGKPEVTCCRYNPGAEKVGTGIIGNPVEAKYGMRKDQIIEAYTRLKALGFRRFGLHAMLVSNEREEAKLIENARILFSLASEIRSKTGVEFEFINLGGGIGIPYRPTDHEVDIDIFVKGVKEEYDKNFSESEKKPKIYMENGRYITGPAGALITRVLNIAEKHRNFVGVDASMANLMRPGMYTTKNQDGSWDECYHHITLLGKEESPLDHHYNVTGSLCENNDQFTRGRDLPRAEKGDIMIIHSTGAHGQAMAFQYNGKLRSAELLVRTDGNIEKIRRAETYDDLFATIV